MSVRFTSRLLYLLPLALAGCGLLGPAQEPAAAPETSAAATVIASTGDSEQQAVPTAVSATAIPLPSSTPSPISPPTEPPSRTATDTPPPPTPTATSPPPEFPASTIRLEPVVGGFERPTYLTHAYDNRLFVVEQAGVIRIIENGALLELPFLDIRDRVNAQAFERGLLSVAFHPDYGQNGQFYVNYTDLQGATVVSRYQVRPENRNAADPASEAILLRIVQPYANHNGGQLQFGPDGYLYVGMGDGGSAGDPQNNGQNPNTLLGSLLRIDVSGAEPYQLPPDNPFVLSGAGPGEIWATGLRNPWRFSFDRLTGDLYLADVGQGAWEEVNYQPAASMGGENYGWNVLEGTHCYASNECQRSGLTMPVAEYSHLEGGCSVTGGYVYRGRRFPSLNGNFLLGDYCSGIIWSLFHQADGTWLLNPLLDTEISISSFGEDVDGELYVLDHTGGFAYQIQS
jgi:glucose/arabinose dehydrogenase